jgi:hypothetical protein
MLLRAARPALRGTELQRREAQTEAPPLLPASKAKAPTPSHQQVHNASVGIVNFLSSLRRDDREQERAHGLLPLNRLRFEPPVDGRQARRH